MAYDNALVAGKLRRWEHYLNSFRLPAWDEIPDFGLYMEQVITLLRDYLDYLPPELKDEQFITASTINNYVRLHVMPEPVKKRYYRRHIAYLIVILTLKQSLNIALIQKIIPMGLEESEVAKIYSVYAHRHRQAAIHFMEQVRMLSGPILSHKEEAELCTDGGTHRFGFHHERVHAPAGRKAAFVGRKRSVKRRQHRPGRAVAQRTQGTRLLISQLHSGRCNEAAMMRAFSRSSVPIQQTKLRQNSVRQAHSDCFCTDWLIIALFTPSALTIKLFLV